MRISPIGTAATLCIAAQLLFAQSEFPPRPAPTRVDVAPGVYLFQTAPYSDAGLDGNSVVIVGEDGVLVFDANGTPNGAEAVLGEIRRLTKAPVKYLVLSHWHWDHWYGAEVYKKAFPALEIIAQERTKVLMSGPAVDFNQDGLDHGLPDHIATVRKNLEKARAGSVPDSVVRDLAQHVALDQWFLAQKVNTVHTVPTRTFTDSLTLTVGSRVVKVMHVDRAITPGDAFLWLPAERIVVAGDLLLNRVTFGLFCYPSGWIKTLEAIDAMNPAVIVPGHNLPMHDKEVLRATIATLKRERDLVKTLKAQGKTVEQAKQAILADSAILALRETLAAGNPLRTNGFNVYLVDWVVPRLYQEIDGTLDDSIPKAP